MLEKMSICDKDENEFTIKMISQRIENITTPKKSVHDNHGVYAFYDKFRHGMTEISLKCQVLKITNSLDVQSIT